MRNYFSVYSQRHSLAVNICLMVVFLCLSSCKKDKDVDDLLTGDEVITLDIPSKFPYPEFPSDNQPTQNRIDLGKKLFFDPALSRDSTISCGSCHQENKFFADNLQVSNGIDGRKGLRNAPSLVNVAYQFSLFWDGGNPTLEQQAIAPIENHDEMDIDVNKVVERLNKNSEYVTLFQKAYKQLPSVYTLTRAIACYERTLIGGRSRYDKFAINHDSTLLTPSEKNGLVLFFNETGDCFHCHQGFNFTDNSFRNNGLYLTYADSGRARITQMPSDIGKFKVPSLRNVEKTAPYMHDGSITTLEGVLDHYISGGKNHPNKSVIIKGLKLSDQEKKDIINFLKALTDE
jgi:cytochrome c peroxidase